MDRTPVTSSNVAAVGYDPATSTLEVEYRNGGVYRYENVTPAAHAALVAAPSIGNHLHTHIKNRHPGNRGDG